MCAPVFAVWHALQKSIRGVRDLFRNASQTDFIMVLLGTPGTSADRARVAFVAS